MDEETGGGSESGTLHSLGKDQLKPHSRIRMGLANKVGQKKPDTPFCVIPFMQHFVFVFLVLFYLFVCAGS